MAVGLNDAIASVIKYGVSDTKNARVDAILHTKDGDVNVNQLNVAHITRDYNNSYGDDVTIETYLPLGNFVKDIYPHREQLEVTMRERRGEIVTMDRYKAIILNADKNMENTIFLNASRTELNKELAYVRFQLIDLYLDKMMQTTTHGIVNNSKLETQMVCVMGSLWNEVTFTGGDYEKGFSVIPVHNERVYANIVMPPVLPILDLPIFLQTKDYGLYYGSCGSYIQRHDVPKPIPGDGESGKFEIEKRHRTLWVYPLYNTTEGKRNVRRLKIFGTGVKQLENVDKTYSIDSTKSLRVVATLTAEIVEPSYGSVRANGNIDMVTESDSVWLQSHKYDTDGSTSETGGGATGNAGNSAATAATNAAFKRTTLNKQTKFGKPGRTDAGAGVNSGYRSTSDYVVPRNDYGVSQAPAAVEDTDDDYDEDLHDDGYGYLDSGGDVIVPDGDKNTQIGKGGIVPKDGSGTGGGSTTPVRTSASFGITCGSHNYKDCDDGIIRYADTDGYIPPKPSSGKGRRFDKRGFVSRYKLNAYTGTSSNLTTNTAFNKSSTSGVGSAGHVMVEPDEYLHNKNYAPMKDGSEIKKFHSIRSNHFDYKTATMKVHGFLVKLTWKFSVPDLLFPGQQVDFYYEKEVEGKLKIRHGRGVLQGVHTRIEGNTEISVSVLFVFISDYGDGNGLTPGDYGTDYGG